MPTRFPVHVGWLVSLQSLGSLALYPRIPLGLASGWYARINFAEELSSCTSEFAPVPALLVAYEASRPCR
jgi:hypothetical protein